MMRKVFASNPWRWAILVVGAIMVALMQLTLSPEEMTNASLIVFSFLGMAITGIIVWLVLGLRQRRKQHPG